MSRESMWTSYRASCCSLPPDKFDSNCRLAELQHAVEGDNVATAYRQGNDVGSSYRCSIFFTTDEQQRVAEDTMADVNALRIVVRKGCDRGGSNRGILGGRA